jgi:CO dehydrogenase maturation factor
MKIAFVGEGGSGKTTLAALTARHLAARGDTVLAVDADRDRHLAVALGAAPEEVAAWPLLGEHLTDLKEWLRAANPRISSAAAMLPTTPPGAGSRLVALAPHTFLFERLVRRAGRVDLAVTGPDDALVLLLNHMVDGHDEYVVVDLAAGADAGNARDTGLFTRFDVLVCVCEPTRRGVEAFARYADHAREYGIALHAVGNRVADAADAEFLRAQLGDALLTCVGRSPFAPGDTAALDTLLAAVAGTPRDPVRYTHQAVEFHLRNAEAWGNAHTGEDLAAQVDPDFVVGYARQTV